MAAVVFIIKYLSINQIFYFYNFVSTTFSLSKFRNQTHDIGKALARPVENKVLIEVPHRGDNRLSTD